MKIIGWVLLYLFMTVYTIGYSVAWIADKMTLRRREEAVDGKKGA